SSWSAATTFSLRWISDRAALDESRDGRVTSGPDQDRKAALAANGLRGRTRQMGREKKERIGWEGARRSASRDKITSVRLGARGLGGKKTEQTANRSRAARR